MKTETKLFALSLVCALAGVGVAAAQQGECDHHGGPGRGHGHMLKKMDTNNDGRITREEFNAQTQEHFKRMDKNNDGVVTQDEIRALHAEHGRGHGNHEGRGHGGRNGGPGNGGGAGDGG